MSDILIHDKSGHKYIIMGYQKKNYSVVVKKFLYVNNDGEPIMDNNKLLFINN